MLEVNDDWTVAVPGLMMLLVSTSRGLGVTFNTWPRLEPRFELEKLETLVCATLGSVDVAGGCVGVACGTNSEDTLAAVPVEGPAVVGARSTLLYASVSKVLAIRVVVTDVSVIFFVLEGAVALPEAGDGTSFEGEARCIGRDADSFAQIDLEVGLIGGASVLPE